MEFGKRLSQYSRDSRYEFGAPAKRAILNNANDRCERCHVPYTQARDHYLEIHHKLAIWIVCAYYPNMPAQIVSSPANGKAVCKDCHPIVDKEDELNHPAIAASLLGMLVEEFSYA